MITRPIDNEFNAERVDSCIDETFLSDLITAHTRKIAPKYRKYQNLYENRHKILSRPKQDDNKPNNRISNDFFSQIIGNL